MYIVLNFCYIGIERGYFLNLSVRSVDIQRYGLRLESEKQNVVVEEMKKKINRCRGYHGEVNNYTTK